MIPIVLTTWTLDKLKKPAFEEKSSTEVAYAGKVYSFAAIQDQATDLERCGNEIWVLLGPTGSGKTTTLKKYLNIFSALNGQMSACEVSCNTFFVDLLDNKTRKLYLSHMPVEKQLKRCPCSEENIKKVLSLRNTASTKTNAHSSRSCMLVTLKAECGNLTILDMMGNEKFEANAATSNSFANLNVSSITQALLNRTSNKRSSNLVTNMIFNDHSLLKLKFVLHLDKTGDKALIKSSLNNIADVVKGFRMNEKPKMATTKPQALPLYARTTAASLSPKKRAVKRPSMVPSKQPLKQPKLNIPKMPASKAQNAKPSVSTNEPTFMQKLRQAQKDDTKAEKKEKERQKRDEKVGQIQEEVNGLKDEVKKARLATVPLKEQIARFKQLFEEAAEELSLLRLGKSDLELDLLKKAEEIITANSARVQSEETAQKIKTEMEAAEQSFKAKTDENEQLQKQIQEQIALLSQKGDELNKQIEDKNSRVVELEEDIKKVKLERDEEVAGLQSRLKSLDKMLQEEKENYRLFEEKLPKEGVIFKRVGDGFEEISQDSISSAVELAELQLSYDTLKDEMKKQEESHKENHEFLKKKIKNLRIDNEHLEKKYEKALNLIKKWKGRNETLASDIKTMESTEAAQKSRISELEEKVKELEKYKSKCEHLDCNLQELRTLSHEEENRLRTKVTDYKQKYKKLLNEQTVPSLFRPVIHEDTDYKTYLKEKRKNEIQSSPLKEANTNREQNKRHSLNEPLKVTA